MELEARQTLRNRQLDVVRSAKLKNETALTQLDKVTAEIAGISTQQGRAAVDLEAAMDELRHLIERADSYSN